MASTKFNEDCENYNNGFADDIYDLSLILYLMGAILCESAY